MMNGSLHRSFDQRAYHKNSNLFVTLPVIIGRRGWGCLDVHNQMWCRWITGFREMHLIADPLHGALRAVPGLGIIRGRNELRRRWHVFDLAPAECPIDLHVLF